MTYAILQFDGRPDAIKCLWCHCVSHNENDVAQLYCGNCHLFHARDGIVARLPDRVDLAGGATHWPETLRKVARAANAAGLAGHQVADVEIGIDMPSREDFIAGVEIKSRIEITYRATPQPNESSPSQDELSQAT